MPQPLKAKLHNKTGRLKNLSKSYNNTSNSSSNDESTSQNTHLSTSSNATIQHPTESTRSANSTHETIPPNSSGAISDSPAIEQFELELCWCIQTLEKSIELGKLNPKQSKIYLSILVMNIKFQFYTFLIL